MIHKQTPFAEDLERRAKALRESQEQLHELAFTLQQHRPALEAIRALLGPKLSAMVLSSWTSNGYVEVLLLRFSVKAFTEIEPLLAAVEAALGVSFDKSKDRPDVGWREYRSTAVSWLRVDAELVGDSDACRKVQVGERVEPIYEFRCDGADATPGTPG